MKKTFVRILYPLWTFYKYAILRPAYAFLDMWSVWEFRNRRYIKLQDTAPINLGPVEERICADLAKDGVSITSMEELFPESDWFSVLKAYGEERRKESFQNKVKTYWREMWDVKRFLLDFKNPFLRLALEDKVLGIANRYMGMYSKLHSIGLSETIPVKPGTPAIQSQQWHRDIGNKKYLKMFIYFSDVEEPDGPFIFLKGSHPNGRWAELFPQINPYTKDSGRISDDDIVRAVPREEILHCIGKAGTVVFADTTGLHKGGYSVRNPRLASITTFYSKHSMEQRRYLNRFRYADDFDATCTQLSHPARIAVERSRSGSLPF